jgi:hypothetical protein
MAASRRPVGFDGDGDLLAVRYFHDGQAVQFSLGHHALTN